MFLLLTCYQIMLPGLYYDEAWDAVSAMQIVQGVPTDLDRGAHIHLLGRDWPLMLDDYQGIISTYLLIPFFLIGGVNVPTLRAFPIAAGLIALVLCYFLARAWFGRGAARVAVLLFAVSPSWVFWSRLGVYVVSEIVPITLGALLAFTAWWRAPGGRNGLLYLGSFLLGLGLATKLLYLWPVVAIGACYILLYGRLLWARRRLGLAALRPTWATKTQNLALVLVVAAACFGAGAFTFLAYNWQTQGTYLKIRGSAVQTEYNTRNTTVIPNLWEEVDRYWVVLDGSYFWFQTAAAELNGPSPVYRDPLMPAAFVIAGLGLLGAAVRRLPLRWPDELPSTRWLLSLALALFPAMCLYLTAFVQPDSRNPLLLAPGMFAVLAAAGAGAGLLAAALRQPGAWARLAGGVLLGTMIASGMTWLLTGRPDSQARGPFDLRLGDLAGVLFWLSLVALLTLLGWSAPATRWQRPLVATVGYLAAVLGQSFSTLSGLWPTHLLVMLPLPYILIGGALEIGARAWMERARMPAGAPAGRRRLAMLGLAGITGVLLVSGLWVDARYHRDLARTGGLFAFSDGIYTLANFLGKAPDRPVIAVEWGIRRQLQILSQGRLDPEEIFQYGTLDNPKIAAAFEAAVLEALRHRTARYVFTAGVTGPYNRFAEFARIVDARGMKLVLEHRSYMRDGRPIYEVYAAQPKGP